MHTKDVKKREVLDFKQFLKVASDPWNWGIRTLSTIRLQK